MADEQQQKESLSQSASNALSTAASAAVAAGKAATGNVVGAAIDVVKDKRLRNAIIAVILSISLLIPTCFMIIGSAITGTVEDLAQSWSESWDRNWEDQGIASNGSALYQYTIGALEAFDQTIQDTITNLFVTEHTVDGNDATNQSIDGSTVVGSGDYETTIKAIFDEASLSGADGALMKRLEMIKGRVEQRGKQIALMATTQYSLEAIGISIATILIEQFSNPILYNGIDWANSSVTIDTSAFEISDVQALKILAAYSIQHECDLTSVDMYDLMDYCGWYDVAFTSLDESALGDESIYQTGPSEVRITEEIGGVVGSGDTISYRLSTPNVPYWRGTFAPQWYYEEIAQIKDHNESYFLSSAAKQAETIPWGVSAADDEIDLSSFSNLADYETYGIIDKLYTSGTAQLLVSRTEYHGADEWADEALANFVGAIWQMWNDAYGEKEKYTEYGNYLVRDEDNVQRFYLSNGKNGILKSDVRLSSSITTYRYYLKNAANGATTSKKVVSGNGGTITWTSLKANTTFKVIEEKNVYVPNEYGGFVRNDSATVTTVIDTFRTFPSAAGNEAYQLQLELRVSYSPRSLDSLTLDLMGLWPNSFNDTEIGADGREYAIGYADHANLARTWTDTYTAPDGTVHTLSFERQYDNQISAYQNVAEGIAEILGISTAGLFGSSNNYGADIVAMANAEYEYYHANNLHGGMRYWDMVKEAIGWNFGFDAAWCVAFVYCCAYQCGYIGEGQPFGPNWIFYVTGAYSEITTNGIAEGHRSSSDDYQPVPGDLIVFAKAAEPSTLTHIGIVEYLDNDNSLHIIHGNSGNSVRKSSYSNYHIGNVVGEDQTFIAGYIHPEYPKPSGDPIYISVTGSMSPTVNSRYLYSGSDTLLISGITRLRTSQLSAFIERLKTDFPEICTDELYEAVAAQDPEAIRTAWNAISSSSKSAAFRAAQLSITENVFIKPLASAAKSVSDFDWTSTWGREELLWGLATTTDQHSALVDVLARITSGFDLSISDEDFLKTLKDENYLSGILNESKDILWPQETLSSQLAWISSINKLLDLLISMDVVIAAADLSTGCSAEQEQQIWDGLLEITGNPYGAAGLMGNLYAESGLSTTNMQNSYEAKLGYNDASYTAAVDSGTYGGFETDGVGYGLAQWTHSSRKRSLYNLARSRRTSIGSLTTQLAQLENELNGSFSGVLETLKNARSVLEASNKVLHVFENPKVQNAEVERTRASFGQYFYEKYALGGSGSGSGNSQASTGGEKMVSAAISEHDYYHANNLRGGQRYWDMVEDIYGYSLPYDYDWCLAFVLCCAYKSGYVGEDQPFGTSWMNSLGSAWAYLKTERGAETYMGASNTYKPVAGDIVMFANEDSPSSFTHIGIVEGVGPDGQLYIVHGNDGNSVSRTEIWTYRLERAIRSDSDTIIAGYLHPNYPDENSSPEFLFSLASPDTNYHGHAVPDLTDSQIANIKNTLYGEAGYSLDAMITIAQAIRDNVDRSPTVTYDNFVTECKFYGGYEERPASEYDTELVNQAFEYVFVEGGSAVQHSIYCFYAPDPPDITSDDDYQALFAVPLEFVIQVGDIRFFSWTE